MEIYEGPVGTPLRQVFTFLIPILVVVNVPARLMAKPLVDQDWQLAAFGLVATVAELRRLATAIPPRVAIVSQREQLSGDARLRFRVRSPEQFCQREVRRDEDHERSRDHYQREIGQRRHPRLRLGRR